VVAGQDYLLVDDVTTQGGTLADLRSYIELRGGHVIGATTLTGARFSHILAPRAETLAKLRAKFPDLEPWFTEQFGHGFDALTDSEAHAVLRYKSADSVRDHLAAERRARDAGEGGSGPRSGESGAGEGGAGEEGPRYSA